MSFLKKESILFTCYKSKLVFKYYISKSEFLSHVKNAFGISVKASVKSKILWVFLVVSQPARPATWKGAAQKN